MALTRRAVIDIGTNSVKLLVADVDGAHGTPCCETSEQTRLGQGLYEHGLLRAEPMAHTARVVARFRKLAEEQGAASVMAIATSAARDARNRQELMDAIKEAAGLEVRIISGDQEAEWAFRGVTTDPGLDGRRMLILDVGGGSTEFILGEKGHHTFQQSFAMGSVRLLEKLSPADPPTLSDLAGCRAWLEEYFNREIGPALESRLRDPAARHIELVGTGGTTTILARMEHRMTGFDRRIIDGTVLTRHRLLEYMVDLWSRSLEDRRTLVGLPPNRADIILMGVGIYEAVMNHFKFEALYISTRGLRFGALLDPECEGDGSGFPRAKE